MKENVRYTRSQFLPGVYVNGSYGISQNYNNGNYSKENFNLNTYIGVSISLPIFESLCIQYPSYQNFKNK